MHGCHHFNVVSTVRVLYGSLQLLCEPVGSTLTASEYIGSSKYKLLLHAGCCTRSRLLCSTHSPIAMAKADTFICAMAVIYALTFPFCFPAERHSNVYHN